jgi:predicted transcriptional regulator
MIIKDDVKAQLDQMPAEFTLDELVERLILLEKIQEGLAQSKKGEVISEQELDKKIESWSK